MIPHIPNQRQNKSNGSKPFNDLVAYIEENKGKEQQQAVTNDFADIVNYASAPLDQETNAEKCIAIRTNGISDLASAAIEMNSVSARNTRSKDPAFHFILSWPEHEKPEPDAIFDAAEHAIKSLGLAEHQYVIAIHGNTDNMHCHVAVNRIHPETYKSRNIEWAQKTLHMAARESEIKHGWTHDNGIYVVETNAKGQKRIVLNKDHAAAINEAGGKDHPSHSREKALPAWHDPESLESWLKADVSRSLKRVLHKMEDWHALHTWLANYGIELTDTGGGGMRLYATSQLTGDVLDIPASKGLRILKRSELEKRWGNFAAYGSLDSIQTFPTQDPDNESEVPMPSIVPDLSHLTNKQIAKGVKHVLGTSFDNGIPPNPNLVLHAESDRRIPPTHRRGSLHELSARGMDGRGFDGETDGQMLLPDALHVHVGDTQAGQDPDMRRSGTGPQSSRGLNRDNSKRQERKEQRAAARADLRNRFAQYRRFVRDGDNDYWERIKGLKADRSRDLKTIRSETKIEKSKVGKSRSLNPSAKLHAILALDAESMRRVLQIETIYQEKGKSLRATRLPPLGWREWLHEQSNLGDQAAISALRGIVYQAQRDAKRNKKDEEQEEAETAEYRYRQLMARLLEEERKEAAIRAAHREAMRPFEVDALLIRYAGVKWHVTGNGNIEYSDLGGAHLFTDRGNRITFDRVRVTDEEIRMALVHAQQKFGNQLTLTGEDPLFSERMARLADDMGLRVLNPELQTVIADHRRNRDLLIAPIHELTWPEEKPTNEFDPDLPLPTTENSKSILAEELIKETPEQRLQALVLAIDPRAQFVMPDTVDSKSIYTGPVAAVLDTQEGFAQHIGRGKYVLHMGSTSAQQGNAVIEVRYRNTQLEISFPDLTKGKGRNE